MVWTKNYGVLGVVKDNMQRKWRMENGEKVRVAGERK
jgi:hypothetical protein